MYSCVGTGVYTSMCVCPYMCDCVYMYTCMLCMYVYVCEQCIHALCVHAQ